MKYTKVLCVSFILATPTTYAIDVVPHIGLWINKKNELGMSDEKDIYKEQGQTLSVGSNIWFNYIYGNSFLPKSDKKQLNKVKSCFVGIGLLNVTYDNSTPPKKVETYLGNIGFRLKPQQDYVTLFSFGSSSPALDEIYKSNKDYNVAWTITDNQITLVIKNDGTEINPSYSVDFSETIGKVQFLRSCTWNAYDKKGNLQLPIDKNNIYFGLYSKFDITPN